jgi:hypothetical protein
MGFRGGSARCSAPASPFEIGIAQFGFYFFFFRHWFSGGKAMSAATPPEVLPMFELLGAVVIFVLAAFAWLLPKERTVLQSTEAEVAFLFPAPVSRRTLIHFKLLKSQAAIILSSFFFTLFSGRLKSGEAWMFTSGMWLLFSTLNLHFLGASFVRTMLLDRGITTRRRRLRSRDCRHGAAHGTARAPRRSAARTSRC